MVICYASHIMPLYYLVYIPMLFIVGSLTFPMETLALIARLKQRLLDYIIERMIIHEVQWLRNRFRKLGKLEGYKQRLIDELLDKHTPTIMQRLENRYSKLTFDEWL